MAKNKAPKIITKKHLARQEREKRQIRMITGIAIGIIAIVVLGIVLGLLNDTLFLNWRKAVTVNGQSYSLHEFQVRVRIERQQLIQQYMSYMQLSSMFGVDPTSDPQMSQFLTQATTELNTPSILGTDVIDTMVHDLLIRQYAKANGITVSAADVEEAAQQALQYYPNGTSTPTLTPTTLIYPTLDATQVALITPTMTPTNIPTNTPAPTQTLAPTSTPDLTSTATLIPSLTPTVTPYTLKGYQSQYQNTLKKYASLGLSDAEFRSIFFEGNLYRERVQAKVTANITHSQEQVWVRVIEVADATTANGIRSQLSTGADFAALAAKDSIDTGSNTKGGDLGWFGRDSTTVPTEIIDAAFPLKIGDISQPIKTSSGYYIIQILGHGVRPLTEAEYQTAVSNAFTAWLTQQRNKSTVIIYNGWVSYVPTSPTLAQAQADDAATSTAEVATYQAQTSGK